MASYLKDKKIELWRDNNDEVDEDGFPVDAGPKKIATLWAYYRQASAKEIYAAMSFQYQVDAIFIINYRPDINPLTDFITFRGKSYSVTAFDEYEGNRQDLKIFARYKK